MTVRSVVVLALGLCLLLPLSMLHAQASMDTVGGPFEKYTIIQYMAANGMGPSNIIRLDNNVRIVMACLEGKTEEQLKAAGLSFTKSQITLLETWGVLEDKDGVLKTALPILDSAKTASLRFLTRRAADAITPALTPDIRAINDALKTVGRQDNAYCILFSYVADGMVWDRFEEQKLVNPKQLTLEKPHWSGEAWAVCPARSFYPGTNSMSDKGVTLNVSWCEPAIRLMTPFFTDWKDLGRMFDDYLADGQLHDSAATAVFKPYGLFDAAGKFNWPVIEEKESNLLYTRCRELSTHIAAEAVKQFPLDQITRQFGFRDNAQTLVVVYHELMWDLMDNLEKQSLVKRPAVFADPKNAAKERVADLIFVVRTEKKDQ